MDSLQAKAEIYNFLQLLEGTYTPNQDDNANYFLTLISNPHTIPTFLLLMKNPDLIMALPELDESKATRFILFLPIAFATVVEKMYYHSEIDFDLNVLADYCQELFDLILIHYNDKNPNIPSGFISSLFYLLSQSLSQFRDLAKKSNNQIIENECPTIPVFNSIILHTFNFLKNEISNFNFFCARCVFKNLLYHCNSSPTLNLISNAYTDFQEIALHHFSFINQYGDYKELADMVKIYKYFILSKISTFFVDHRLFDVFLTILMDPGKAINFSAKNVSNFLKALSSSIYLFLYISENRHESEDQKQFFLSYLSQIMLSSISILRYITEINFPISEILSIGNKLLSVIYHVLCKYQNPSMTHEMFNNILLISISYAQLNESEAQEYINDGNFLIFYANEYPDSIINSSCERRKCTCILKLLLMFNPLGTVQLFLNYFYPDNTYKEHYIYLFAFILRKLKKIINQNLSLPTEIGELIQNILNNYCKILLSINHDLIMQFAIIHLISYGVSFIPKEADNFLSIITSQIEQQIEQNSQNNGVYDLRYPFTTTIYCEYIYNYMKQYKHLSHNAISCIFKCINNTFTSTPLKTINLLALHQKNEMENRTQEFIYFCQVQIRNLLDTFENSDISQIEEEKMMRYLLLLKDLSSYQPLNFPVDFLVCCIKRLDDEFEIEEMETFIEVLQNVLMNFEEPPASTIIINYIMNLLKDEYKDSYLFETTSPFIVFITEKPQSAKNNLQIFDIQDICITKIKHLISAAKTDFDYFKDIFGCVTLLSRTFLLLEDQTPQKNILECLNIIHNLIEIDLLPAVFFGIELLISIYLFLPVSNEVDIQNFIQSAFSKLPHLIQKGAVKTDYYNIIYISALFKFGIEFPQNQELCFELIYFIKKKLDNKKYEYPLGSDYYYVYYKYDSLTLELLRHLLRNSVFQDFNFEYNNNSQLKQ